MPANELCYLNNNRISDEGAFKAPAPIGLGNSPF